MVFRYAVDVSTDSNSPIYAGAVMSCWRGVCRVCRGRVVLGSDFDIRTDSVVQLWIPWFSLVWNYFILFLHPRTETRWNTSKLKFRNQLLASIGHINHIIFEYIWDYLSIFGQLYVRWQTSLCERWARISGDFSAAWLGAKLVRRPNVSAQPGVWKLCCARRNI